MEPLRFLQIEPTTRCNFSCGFCAGRKMEQTDLPLARFVAALDAFPGIEHIELQGEGESLLHPRLFDMIGLARERGLKVSFITNGSLLSPENVERLLALGIEKVSVSIESADSETFRAIRGGKLEKVEQGLATLLAARDLQRLDRPVVGLSITVLRRTQGELPAILALYRRLGLDGGVTVQPLESKEDYAGNYDAAMRTQLLDEKQVAVVWLRFLANREVRRIQKEKRPIDGFFDQLMDGWRPGRRTCPWLDAGLYVDRNGSAAPCCMVKDPKHSLGQLERDGAAAILARRADLRRELASGVVPAACGGCELARFAVLGKGGMLYWGVRGLLHRWFGKLGEARPQ